MAFSAVAAAASSGAAGLANAAAPDAAKVPATDRRTA
jgi:hypothetical protein